MPIAMALDAVESLEQPSFELRSSICAEPNGCLVIPSYRLLDTVLAEIGRAAWFAVVRWRPRRGAIIVFDGRRLRTGRHGHAQTVAKLRRRRRHAAILKVGRHAVARAFVVVVDPKLRLTA